VSVLAESAGAWSHRARLLLLRWLFVPEWDTGQGGAGVNGIDERGARNRGSGCIPGAREFAGIEISSQSCGTHVGELMVLAVHVSRGVERL